MRVKLTILLLIFWLGIHFSIGYITAPLLFKNLEKIQAGNIAGQGFHIVSLVNMIAIILLFFLDKKSKCFFRAKNFTLLFIAFLLVLTYEFIITPVIVALKSNTSHWLLAQFGGNFAIWHGISSFIYLVIFILGLLYTWTWAKQISTDYSAYY